MFKRFITDISPKNHGLRELFKLIYRYGPASRAQLVEITQYKQSTLARMIEELIDYGYIKLSGTTGSFVGRPPVLYQVEPKCSYIISVNITRMKTKVALFDIALNLVDQQSFNMTKEQTPVIVIPKIIKMIQHFMDKYVININKLLGIGIGMIGPVDTQKGLILEPEPFFGEGWENIPIANIIEEFFPVKIILENWSSAAVLGECNHGNLPYKNILYAFNSWGLGFGVMVNGSLLHNRLGNAGSGAHTIIEHNGRLCSCGKRGCLHSYVSLPSILSDVQMQQKSLDWKDKDWGSLSTEEVIDLLKQEQYLVHEVVLESARYYGIGIANMVNTLQSELIILSGPLIYEYPGYFEMVKESALQYLHEGNEPVKLTKGALREDAAAVGAAYMVWNDFVS